VKFAQLDGGRALYVLDEDPRADALIATRGELNPESLRLWRLLCAAGSWTTVMDVGANYGEMVLGAALPPSARVFAFEPAPAVAACLRASVVEAELPVEIVESAVGAETGPAELFEDPTWSGTTTATPRQAAAHSHRTAVQMTRLDDFLTARGLRAPERYLVKIDVEGGERPALEGFLPLLTDAASATLMVEVKHTTEEDLRWMIDAFFLHLVSRADMAPVPVATVRDYRRLVASGFFHEEDAVLSTHLLGTDLRQLRPDAVMPEHPPVSREEITREISILRAEIAATAVVYERALLRSAGGAAEGDLSAAAAEAQRGLVAAQEAIRSLEAQRVDLLASHSWRLTRPLRAVARRLRPDS
jgi:FkbM family methyltransferase